MLQVKSSWNDWQLLSKLGRRIWAYQPDSMKIGNHLQNANNISQEKIQQFARDFSFDKRKNPNSADRVYRNQRINEKFQKFSGAVPQCTNPQQQKVIDALINGINYFSHLQNDDGHWPGDYGGPLFLLPGLIIASYVSSTPFPLAHQEMMKIYLFNHQSEDGGWGMHIEGASTMFGSVMQYVSLRLLGVGKEDPRLVKARSWIQSNGGATGIPSWGKFYLAILNLYDWQGFNSLFPEMWLFPKWLPVHPWRYWCHSRLVYLPMAYCYAERITVPLNDLLLALRDELFTCDFQQINWPAQRNVVCAKDIYTQQSPVLKWMNFVTNGYEKIHLKSVRRKALKYILDYLNAEDQQTNYLDLGPVSQAINSICIWHAYGKDTEQFRGHVARWYDYLWVAEDGMKMNGYNGSQLWDVAFASRAILESELGTQFKTTLEKSYQFINFSQIREQHATHEQFFRHPMIGSWPFSTAEQGWPVADCTAEGLSATLKIHQSGLVNQEIDEQRLKSAVDVILSYQNKDGGWPTYELTRGPKWLEKLNPSEIFADIILDYSWTECTAACVVALIEYHEQFPEYQNALISKAINRGLKFIIGQQGTDGSWYGGWAICFTYATWFAIEALSKAKGKQYLDNSSLSKSIDRACAFLLEKQREDGGWGETFESCSKMVYSEADISQVVNTAWALLALMAAEHNNIDAIKQGIQLLIDRQTELGDWQQENISGVFNYNCMITYSTYRNTFPIWALNRYFKEQLC